MRKLMWEVWSERNLILSSQFGFVSGSSSSSQPLKFLDDLTLALDNHFVADVIYMDFSKAFNSVHHERLLCKLMALRIKGKTSRWICSFLSGRKEIVVVNGVSSSPTEMISGVPQGS